MLEHPNVTLELACFWCSHIPNPNGTKAVTKSPHSKALRADPFIKNAKCPMSLYDMSSLLRIQFLLLQPKTLKFTPVIKIARIKSLIKLFVIIYS